MVVDAKWSLSDAGVPAGRSACRYLPREFRLQPRTLKITAMPNVTSDVRSPRINAPSKVFRNLTVLLSHGSCTCTADFPFVPSYLQKLDFWPDSEKWHREHSGQCKAYKANFKAVLLRDFRQFLLGSWRRRLLALRLLVCNGRNLLT